MIKKPHILAVDDEEDLLELVRYNLSREGYQVTCLATGDGAVQAVRAQKPDLVVLDLLLPGMDGLEICRQIKQDPSLRHTPVLLLTAKSEDVDVVAGLELGADDYMTKPFSPRVLLARIRAVLRRRPTSAGETEQVVRIHDLVIHPGRHEVLLDGQPLALTFTEFRLLHFLAQRPGWAFSRMQIVDAVKGEDYPVTDRSVDVQVAGLRKKLGASGRHIETVRGVGYRFRE
jgi:two-component system phosphate regulon response regulator PhoB